MLRILSNLVAAFVAFGLFASIGHLATAASPPGLTRTDVKIEAKDIKKAAESAAGSPNPLTLRSLSAAHASDIHPYVATPDSKKTHTLRVQSK